YVTAAKQLVAGRVAIDGIAGPSELVVLADGAADPAAVASDLVAQAEHDPDAFVALVATDEPILARVRAETEPSPSALPPAARARASLERGLAVAAPDLDAAIALCDRLAPEHLLLRVADADRVARRLRHYGALFLGRDASVVFGDYGAGPNHVLPTGG